MRDNVFAASTPLAASMADTRPPKAMPVISSEPPVPLVQLSRWNKVLYSLHAKTDHNHAASGILQQQLLPLAKGKQLLPHLLGNVTMLRTVVACHIDGAASTTKSLTTPPRGGTALMPWPEGRSSGGGPTCRTMPQAFSYRLPITET